MAKKNTKLAKVFHFDLQGKREEKYEFLNQNSIASIQWNKLEPNEPNFFLVKKTIEGHDLFMKGFSIDEIFQKNTSGITTGNDKNLISENKFSENNNFYSYKPFDNRYINYDVKLIQRARFDIMKHFKHKNLGLCLMRTMVNTSEFKTVFITSKMMDKNFYGFQSYVFPLYLYSETTAQQTIEQSNKRTPNLNKEIALKIARSIRYMYDADVSSVNFTYRDTGVTLIAPLDILDYIYAVLHSPTYREKYKEFLKIDFPRIPYPKKAKTFWQLVKLGGEIRQIHLLESPTVEKYITQYPIDGDNVVIKPVFRSSDPSGLTGFENLLGIGRVYINDTQYFDNVPEIAWNFYIGGYQPAQKWLKDRKDRKLEFEDILHYQKIIVALSETDRLMTEIDKIEI